MCEITLAKKNNLCYYVASDAKNVACNIKRILKSPNRKKRKNFFQPNYVVSHAKICRKRHEPLFTANIKEVVVLNAPKHLGPLFKTIGNTVDNQITQQVQATGLTSAQMFILHYLSRHVEKPIYQKDLEEALELSHATVAGIISRLESKDFVKLVPSEQDKRCKQIIATDKARQLDEATERIIDGTEKKLLSGFSDDEIEQLRDYLVRLLYNLGIELPKIKEDRK